VGGKTTDCKALTSHTSQCPKTHLLAQELDFGTAGQVGGKASNCKALTSHTSQCPKTHLLAQESEFGTAGQVGGKASNCKALISHTSQCPTTHLLAQESEFGTAGQVGGKASNCKALASLVRSKVRPPWDGPVGNHCIAKHTVGVFDSRVAVCNTTFKNELKGSEDW